MILQKEVTALADILGDKENIKFLKITKEKSYATDGKILVIAKNIPQNEIDNYPVPNEFNLADEAYLTKETLKAIEKNIPKKTPLPILSTFIIGKNNNSYVIYFTDLTRSQHILQSVEKSEEEYPDVEMVYNGWKKASHISEITIDAVLLEKMLKCIKKYVRKKSIPVKFYFYDNKTLVRWEYEEDGEVKLEGIIMGMSEDD